jgi:hypothetical protein
MSQKKKRRQKAASPDEKAARWEAHLRLRAQLMQSVADCIAGTGDCSNICACIGDACQCAGIGRVPAVGGLSTPPTSVGTG